MARIPSLTRAFLESHPAEAARVIEHVAPESCAALLNALPIKLSIEVLKHVLPAHAARCLERLKPPAAVGLLRALSPQTGAGLLRYLPEAPRTALLNELPAGVAGGLQRLLSYPDDTVGAWTDVRVPALPVDALAKEALERARRAKDDDAVDLLYVVNSKQYLQGVVRLSDAVRAAARAQVADIMRTSPPRISARTPLAAAGHYAGWSEFQSLPVVDFEGRFVGALHYGTLVRALAQRYVPPLSTIVTDALTGVAGAYWLGMSGLIRTAVALVNGPGANRRLP